MTIISGAMINIAVTDVIYNIYWFNNTNCHFLVVDNIRPNVWLERYIAHIHFINYL